MGVITEVRFELDSVKRGEGRDGSLEAAVAHVRFFFLTKEKRNIEDEPSPPSFGRQ